jgi:hypothetical protein
VARLLLEHGADEAMIMVSDPIFSKQQFIHSPTT